MLTLHIIVYPNLIHRTGQAFYEHATSWAKKSNFNNLVNSSLTENISGNGTELGNLSKDRAAEYRRLQETEEGQQFLEKNLDKMSDPPVTNETERKARADSIMAIISKKVK